MRPEVVELAVAVVEAPEHARAALASLNENTFLAGLAVAFAARDQITRSLIEQLVRAFSTQDVKHASIRLLGEILRAGITGKHAADLIALLLNTLAEPGYPQDLYAELLDSLVFATEWRIRFVDCGEVLRLLKLDHLSAYRKVLLNAVIEPALYAAGALQRECLAELARICGNTRHILYLRYFLGGENVEFPAHGALRQALGDGPRRVLVVQNIHDGQGDEIIRAVPLMQAFLAFNPRLEIAFVTGRGYLYAHRRLTVVPLADVDGVDALLRRPFDAVVDFFESGIPVVNYDCGLESKLKAHLQCFPPALLISASKGLNHFVYERVEFEGRNWARELHLDTQRVPNVYETTFRLAAELGLPLQAGMRETPGERVLAGAVWELADREWRCVTARAAKCPIALLNPFGGAEPLKGYTDTNLDALSTEVGRLVADGYFVVLIPNGTKWGTAPIAQAALDRLSAQQQASVWIAPDAAGSVKGRRAGFESPDFSYADTVTRLLVYFVRFADLVVTVEGWMVHAAYCLGKSYRILMAPYSHPPEWQPYGQSGDQQMYAELAPFVLDRERPVMIEQPRKFTFLALLHELGVSADPIAFPLLSRAFRSPDREIRRTAAQALGCFGGAEARVLLLEAISDSHYAVRAVAAEALLASGEKDVPLELLQAHVEIGAVKRDWTAIRMLGETARQALEVALRDEDPVIRREAEQAIDWLDSQSRERAVVHAWLSHKTK